MSQCISARRAWEELFSLFLSTYAVKNFQSATVFLEVLPSTVQVLHINRPLVGQGCSAQLRTLTLAVPHSWWRSTHQPPHLPSAPPLPFGSQITFRCLPAICSRISRLHWVFLQVSNIFELSLLEFIKGYHCRDTTYGSFRAWILNEES